MTFVITQPCIDVQDQSCVEVCPVDCIHFEEGADRMLYIEPEVCIDCGACEPVCPVTAIYDEPDVPADQARFTEINALWFSDPAAARAQVGGAPAPAPSEPAAEAPAEEEAPAAADEEALAPAEEAPAEAAEAPAAAAASAVEAPAPAVAASTQVEAVAEEVHHEGVVVAQYRLPSPLSAVAVVGLLISLAAVWLAPGDSVNNDTPLVGALVEGFPDWSIWGDLEGPSAIGMLALLPAVLFLGLFIRAQAHDLRRFDAKRERRYAEWREAGTPWRRSEESRRFELERTVAEVARERFPFPNEQHPMYRTHVNVPEPSFALEFTAGGTSTSRVFPDIIVVEHLRNRPVMVAQVETRETVTRRQAELVWAPLETADAPLYLYVPAGLAARARDYAMAASIEHVEIRTWRRQPGGMIVQEV